MYSLLKIAAAYDPTVKHFHPTTLKKRQMYVRSSMKLLINCTTRHKSLLSTNSKAFTNTLSRMLDEMETVITSSEYLGLKTNQFENLGSNSPAYSDLNTGLKTFFLNCCCK